MAADKFGISGFSLDLPPYRVALRDWCDWTGNDWNKISNVVGHGFRLRGPNQNAYTMAANAVLRLIDEFQVDPRRVRYLALGTESSTDNSAGAVIVKGMVNQALQERGSAPIARACEVPEFKHACLGGIYAMKNALRFLATDGGDSAAIVVCSDAAEYARGSSGEPTQGAGAVAMLLERDPRLLAVDLAASGSASEYRAVDFRKPLTRLCRQAPRSYGQVLDLPVFNGKFSTSCYIDQTLHALDAMCAKRHEPAAEYYRRLNAVFLHRPYRRMPESAWAMAYLFALAHGSRADQLELEHYAQAVGVDYAALRHEMQQAPSLLDWVAQDAIGTQAYPLTSAVVPSFRGTPAYRREIDAKLAWGSALMLELGNLYTGALPAWLAAGVEEAGRRGAEWAGADLLVIGYGSGDAAEAIPMTVQEGWSAVAERMQLGRALANAVDLTREQYESLHDEGVARGLVNGSASGFVLDRVGQRNDPQFQDQGIEYYRFLN